MTKESNKLILVDSDILPPVFGKVIEAKRLLRLGEVSTVNDAVKAVGISRTAFYKYKNHVYNFSDKKEGRIITLHVILKDEAGVLSQFISALYKNGANILTISQNIPVSGKAVVSVSASIPSHVESSSDLISSIKDIYGVISIQEIIGD